MGIDRKNKRRSRKVVSEDQVEKENPEKKWSGRLLAWVAGIVATALAGALTTWLTDWGKTLSSREESGPAVAAVVEVRVPQEAHRYVLATAVTSAVDRATLESGTASGADIQALMARHGAAVVGDLEASIVLEGRRSSLRITDIRPRIRPTRTAPTAALLPFPSSGVVESLPVSADLDRDAPVLEAAGRPFLTHTRST